MKIKSIVSLIVALGLIIGNLSAYALTEFAEDFAEYSTADGVTAPSGWSLSGAESGASTVAPGAEEGNEFAVMTSSNDKVLMLVKYFDTSGQNDLVFECDVYAEDSNLNRNVLCLQNSTASGSTFTAIVSFDKDGKIRLNNRKFETNKYYQTQKWHNIKVLSQIYDSKNYITVMIDEEIISEKFEIYDPSLKVTGIRFMQSGESGVTGVMRVDNVTMTVPSQDDINAITAKEADYIQLSETEFADPQPSSSYSVTADEEEIFCEKLADVSYAQLQCSDTVSVKVSVGEEITDYNISPHSYGIQAVSDGSTLSFSLEANQKVIVNINELENLCLFANGEDKYINLLQGDNVTDVTQNGVSNDGKTLETERIQKLLDAAGSSEEGGVIYFPPGKYLTGSLRVGSNTVIYLAEGAVLKAYSNTAGFRGRVYSVNGNALGASGLLFFDNAQNSKLVGRGTVDGNGAYLRSTYGIILRDVLMYNCSNITVEDVILRNPAAWNSHILLSENITYKNVKILNDLSVANTDGIDPDSTSNFLIDGVFAYCSDDTVAVKTSDGYFYNDTAEPCSDITVQNGVFYTKKSALKIGTETTKDITNITFENNDVLIASRTMMIRSYDGAKVSDVKFINNKTEKFFDDTTASMAICFEVAKRDAASAVGSISDVFITDAIFESTAGTKSDITGMEDGEIRNVFLQNYNLCGYTANTISQANITANEYASNIIIVNGDESEIFSQNFDSFSGSTAEKVVPDAEVIYTDLGGKWSYGNFTAGTAYALGSTVYGRSDNSLNMVCTNSSDKVMLARTFSSGAITDSFVIEFSARVDTTDTIRNFAANLSEKSGATYVPVIKFTDGGKFAVGTASSSDTAYKSNVWYRVRTNVEFTDSGECYFTTNVTEEGQSEPCFVSGRTKVSEPIGYLGGIRMQQSASSAGTSNYYIDDIIIYKSAPFNISKYQLLNGDGEAIGTLQSGDVTVVTSVLNNTSGNQDAIVITALKKGHTLVDCSFEEKSVAAGSKEAFLCGITVPQAESGEEISDYRIEVFVWDNTSQCKPLGMKQD